MASSNRKALVKGTPSSSIPPIVLELEAHPTPTSSPPHAGPLLCPTVSRSRAQKAVQPPSTVSHHRSTRLLAHPKSIAPGPSPSIILSSGDSSEDSFYSDSFSPHTLVGGGSQVLPLF